MKNKALPLFIGSLLIWATATLFVVSKVQPDTEVITHISVTGKTTTSKSAGDLYLLLGISLAIIGGTFLMSLYTEKMNYPFALTAENKKQAFKKMKIFLGIICLAVTTLFMCIALKSLNLLAVNNVTVVLTSIIFFSAVLPIVLIGLLREKTVIDIP